MDWIDLAQVTNKWRDLVKEIRKYRVLNMRGFCVLTVDMLACNEVS